jgi:hypothetical protein
MVVKSLSICNRLAASETFFRSTCATLFERMLNTVPKGVQLTQVIEPLPVKPHGIGFIRLTNGNFIMKGQARVCYPSYNS